MTEKHTGFSPAGRVLILAASFVVVVAGLREAQSVLVPFLIALFVSVICAPALFWLRKQGIPTAVALLFVILGIVVLALAAGALISGSVSGFSEAAPEYQARLEDKAAQFLAVLEEYRIPLDKGVVLDQLNPGAAMQYASRLLKSLGGLLTNTFFIFLVVIFLLLEAMDFPDRLRNAFSETTGSLDALRRVSENVNRYMLIKTVVSFWTGIAVWLFLVILGVDFPVLWGMLAFLFNFVPNIGSILAAVPAVLLAIVQFGFGRALVAAGGYLVINVLVGSIIEPRVMGRGLGVSTLVVFLSLVFWGWVLGPVGMLLSVPLTVLVKIALDSREETRWISILMGSVPDESTDEPDPGDSTATP